MRDSSVNEVGILIAFIAKLMAQLANSEGSLVVTTSHAVLADLLAMDLH